MQDILSIALNSVTLRQQDASPDCILALLDL